MSIKCLPVALFTSFLLSSCTSNNAPFILDAPTAKTTDTDTEAAPTEPANADDEGTITNPTDPAEEADNEPEEDQASQPKGADQENVKLVVKDQTTAGQIIVESVSTSHNGWVSIHKSQEDGGIILPDSIGEARVDAGDNEEVVVDLWEAPYLGEKLWVLLHVDAGEQGRYEFPEVDVAVRKNGETMARSFEIKEAPDEESQADEES